MSSYKPGRKIIKPKSRKPELPSGRIDPTTITGDPTVPTYGPSPFGSHRDWD